MKRLFCILALVAMTGWGVSFAQDIIMHNNTSISQSTDEMGRNFYDPGGLGDFGIGIKDTLTISNGMGGAGSLIVQFVDFAMGYGDTLYIFDGPDCNALLIGFYNTVRSPEEIAASGTHLTFVFHSDSIDDYGILKSGWIAQAYVVPTAPEVVWLTADNHTLETNSCNVKFYDSGGPNGNINETGTYYCEFSSPVSHVRMEFEYFEVNGVMKIYDGKYNSPDRRLIGQWHNTTLDPQTHKPPTLFSSDKTLTVEYVPASGDNNKRGWEASITCETKLFENPGWDACPKVVAEDENGIELPDTIPHTCGVPLILIAKEIASGKHTDDYTVERIVNSELFHLLDSLNQVLLSDPASHVPANADDQWLDPVNLGFDFYFFGKSYDKVYPGTNGLIDFNYKPHPSSQYTHNCAYEYSIPGTTPPYSTAATNGDDNTRDANTPYAYKNCVYGVFEDVDISLSIGSVHKGITGDPEDHCQKFIFSFNELPQFGANSLKCSYMIVLHEGTNIIDVYIKKRQCCASTNDPGTIAGTEGIVGIQNNTNSQILIAPTRGMGGWSIQPPGEVWRFTPITPLDEMATMEWFADTIAPDHLIGNTRKIVVDPQKTTKYYVQYTFTNAGNATIKKSDSVIVVVDVPDLAVDSFRVCPGKSITLKPIFGDTTDVHPLHYYWNSSVTDTLDTLNVIARSTQDYELKVLFDNNCQRTVKTTVHVDTMAVPVITGDTVICYGDMIRLVAAVDSPSYILRWANGLENSVFTARPTATADYVVKAVHPNDEECFTTDTLTVKVNPLPDLSFTYSPEEVVIEHGKGTLTCHTDCDPDYAIRWNFNDRYNPDNNIVEGLHTVSHDFIHVGSYDITLAGTNEFECRDSVTEHVRVYVPVSFVMPSAFSPNDDGLNDVFKPVYEGVEVAKYLMMIYDRAGRLVFKSTNPSVGWDGRDMNGLEMPSGVYVYYIHHWTQMDDLRGNGQPVVTGSFTLIR